MSVPLPDLQEATIKQLQTGLAAGHFTSVDLVKAYIRRIQEVNPLLKAIISVSPAAIKAAENLDKERKAGNVRGLLHGIPIAIKDNIATRREDGMDTTAGSFALQGAVVKGDADCVARLRKAGAIILCKTNLSEFANFRGVVTGAWSPVGGQCTSPYYPNGHPSGSSSGSGVAAAVGLATVTLGTETGGSIISPSNFCSIVGIRPTVGLVSQDRVTPVAPLRDAVGPMTRTVEDAAIVLQTIASKDVDYTESLKTSRLEGVRILAPTNLQNWETNKYLGFGKKIHLDEACRVLEQLGAEVIRAALPDEFVELQNDDRLRQYTMEVEIKAAMQEHLKTFESIPSGAQTLQDIVDFIKNDPRESDWPFDTSKHFDAALSHAGVGSQRYKQARERTDQSKVLIDQELSKHNAHAFVVLSVCHGIWGDAGYPQITVPLGYLGDKTPIWQAKFKPADGKEVDLPYPLHVMHPNTPFGLTLAGTAYSEATLIKIAHAFESATHARLLSKTYPEATPKTQLSSVL